LNQIDLAAAASVSKNTIVDFEKGRRNPTNKEEEAVAFCSPHNHGYDE
jgi:DNA-binding XRE family transcriptional regulator